MRLYKLGSSRQLPAGATVSAQPVGEMQPLTGTGGTLQPGTDQQVSALTGYEDPTVRTGLEDTVGGGFTEETAPEWGTEGYQQAMYNRAREQISGQTAADVEYGRTLLGDQGLRGGESGIATRALLNIRRKGAKELGGASRDIAINQMGARYGQEQDQMEMLMRLYGMQTGEQRDRFQPYWAEELQAGDPGAV